MSRDELRKKLQDDLDTAEWKLLTPHHTRGAVLVVSQELDLVDVALHIAEDQAETVQKWLEKSLIMRPTDSQVHAWGSQSDKPFRFVILQPYVLVQELAN